MKNLLNILMLTIALSLLSISNGWAGQQTMNMVASAANPCGMKHGNPCNPCGMKQSNPCNPCGMKHGNPCNPCGMKHGNPCNPCGMKHGNPCNPCGMKHGNPCNPCGMKHGNPCNPCGMKHGNPCNPCGMKQSNPCSKGVSAMQITRPAGSKLYSNASRTTLVKEGKYLFNSQTLGSNGLSCNTCHSGTAGFGSSFAQSYPHKVAMASDQAGVQQVSADEFVQFCVVVPLKGKVLNWQSRKLAALTAYVVDVKQKAFRVVNANPCNPCGMKSRNPCSRY